MIRPGTYRTERGYTAFVWDWGKNMLGEECWRGTIEEQGMACWDKEGNDLSDPEDRLMRRI